ncbi:Uncharacterized protein YEL023C [Ceratocystis fimbriata CBS 114723]|uniref:Uncharacterized protein YEL023C n=1 Tax=Ceratocystis fimbriata CBS 114723 TaxID=1035309 RepID=A0A2C5X002_9PEZI|nr:Uncharacterized protein YEL023C [Ceratocystis fimbriata CBS 114723]
MAQNLLSPGAAMNMATSHDQSQPRPPTQPHIHFKELTPESIHSQTGTPVTSSSTPALSTPTPAPVTVHPSENPQVNVEFPDLGPHNVPQQIHVPRKLVLCFDGTGNKFHGDDSDSNILKLFRMLDRTAHDQFHYYQPGIGTYVQTDDLSHTGIRERCKAWIQKAKDSAIGSSFDQHVVGGYRFLMRYYNHGDEIYIFGFSRGAYIARFLSEMLDMVGLLSHGNEEMIYFAWKTFSQWQCRSGDTGKRAAENKHKMYDFMKGFRETFSRPVRRIRFLGLFDTVNSVPRFETAWMQRSKFPYTARSKAKVIRHAVSIDERRAKFRQDLIYQAGSNDEDEDGIDDDIENGADSAPKKSHRRSSSAARTGAKEASKADASANSAPAGESSRGRSRPHSHYERYRCPSRSRSRAASAAGSAMSRISAVGGPVPPTEFDGYDSEDDAKQDIDEVWFSGGHGDVGGGWDVDRPGCMNISHVPLTWMVREASRAGLRFDVDKVIATGCAAALKDIDPERAEAEAIPDIQVEVARSSTGSLATEKTPPSRDISGAADESGDPRAKFHDILHKAETNVIHDSLVFGGGLSFGATLSWRIMEYLPFRRMDLQSDGTWKPIRWPLPRGETRDMPRNSRIHGSVIRRMQQDLNYRPGNLVIGGGGRGVRVAPASYGMGEWVCVEGHGDPVAEIYVRRG